MNRACSVLFSLSLLTSLVISGLSVSAAEKPNVIFFFTDDQAYDTLGCYGNPDVKTKNIDKLASKGVVFDRHYNTTSICMASRVNVMTGLYEFKSGCNFDHGPLTKDKWLKSYPVLLREAGYMTAFGGKFGFAVVDQKGAKGSDGSYNNLPVDDFDFWVGGTGQTNYATAKNKYLARFADKYPHSSSAYGAAGQEFIQKAKAAGKPFSLTLFFKAPHRPVDPDPKFDDVYANTTFRKLPNYGREHGKHFAKQSTKGRQYERFVSWGYHTDESYQKAMRLYHQQIYGVDVSVGMVMDELEKQGLADNTVVIFSSDNGFFNGSHGMGSKVLHYEEGSRVPLIIYDPRTKYAGKSHRVKKVTGNVDITATILEVAGVSKPEKMDGVSLMPYVNDPTDQSVQVRDDLPLIQVWGPVSTHSLGVVTNEHKYLYWFYGADGMTPTEELFDLGKDPYELTSKQQNPEYKQVLEDMRKRYGDVLSQWQSEGVDYNNYEKYGTLFDRSIPWSGKSSLVNKKKMSSDKQRKGKGRGKKTRDK